jgi:phosphoglycolate phosphatase
MNVSLRDKKLILLDFDGTIADTVQVFVHVNNSHFKEYGTKFLTKEDVVRLKKMTDFEALQFLDINFIEFFLISRKFLKQIRAYGRLKRTQ